MHKVPVGYGYSNDTFVVGDFLGQNLRPLIIDVNGRYWRGMVKTNNPDNIVIQLSDGRCVAIPRSDIVFVGAPRP